MFLCFSGCLPLAVIHAWEGFVYKTIRDVQRRINPWWIQVIALLYQCILDKTVPKANAQYGSQINQIDSDWFPKADQARYVTTGLSALNQNRETVTGTIFSFLGDPRGSPDVFLMDISLVFLSWHANNNPFYMGMSLSESGSSLIRIQFIISVQLFD